MQLAPIILFVYNRLPHVRMTVDALQKNESAGESELFVFSDGPRSAADETKIREIRAYLKSITGFKKISLIERSRNLGLAQSVITGVSEIVARYGRGIVLEDDMVTSPYFLRFMNEALHCYETEERVISIHGYVYPTPSRLPETFFLRGADCWGWGTWKRGWDLFEADGSRLLAGLQQRKMTHQFDLDGAFPYTKMLEEQIQGKVDSWAIRWHASAFLLDKLTLYPGRSLIFNTGLDASGTHCTSSAVFDAKISGDPVRVGGIPIAEDQNARRALSAYLRSLRPSFARRTVNRLIEFAKKTT